MITFPQGHHVVLCKGGGVYVRGGNYDSLYQVIQRTILPNLQHYNGGRKKQLWEGEGEYL